MECFDGERICGKCNFREAWQSCRDCIPIRDFCEECFEEYHRGMRPHTVIGLIRHRRPLPSDPKCKWHFDNPRQMVCSQCQVSLCVRCLHDKNTTCPVSSDGRHDTQLASDAAKARRKDIGQALGVAVSKKTEFEGCLTDLNRKEEEFSKLNDQAETDLRYNYGRMQQNRGDNFRTVSKTLAEHREQVRVHLDTIQKRSAKAQTLLSRSSDVEICEQAHSLVSQLTAPYDYTPLAVPTAFLESVTAQGGTSEQVNIVGSLVITTSLQTCKVEPVRAIRSDAVHPSAKSTSTQTELADSDSSSAATIPSLVPLSGPSADIDPTIIHTKGYRLNVHDVLWPASDRCTVETSVGPVLVEAFGQIGLHSTGPDGERVKVSKDGVEHYGVCTGMDDGRVVYSTTYKKATITMYVTMNGKLVQLSEVAVQGAKGLTRIRAGPTTGRLVVVDKLSSRLTIHSPDCALLRCIGPTLCDDIRLRRPNCAAWSQCEKYVCVSDWRSDEKDERVIKFSYTDPPQLMWKLRLEGEMPVHVQPIGQCVYITHRSLSQATVLSDVDGSVLRVISCPWRVREVKSTAHGRVELIYYNK